MRPCCVVFCFLFLVCAFFRAASCLRNRKLKYLLYSWDVVVMSLWSFGVFLEHLSWKWWVIFLLFWFNYLWPYQLANLWKFRCLRHKFFFLDFFLAFFFKHSSLFLSLNNEKLKKLFIFGDSMWEINFTC